MIKTLFQPAPFDALPILVVFFAQKNDIFARNNGRALRQRNHLALHHVFDGAGDFDDKFFRLTARFDLRVAGGFFQNKLRRVAVNPLSNFIKTLIISFSLNLSLDRSD